MHRGTTPELQAAPDRAQRPSTGRRASGSGRSRGRGATPRAALGRSLARALLGLAVAAAAAFVLVAIVRRSGSTPRVADTPDEVLLSLLAWVGVLLATWLAVGSLLAVLALLPGAAGRVAEKVAERVTPLAVRKLLTVALGASVGSVALPAAPVVAAGSAVAVGPGSSRPLSGSPPALSPGYTPTPGPGPEPATKPAPNPAPIPATDPAPDAVPTTSTPPPSSRRQPAAARSDSSLPLGAQGPGFAPSPRRSRPSVPVGSPGFLPTAPVPVHDTERSRLLAPAPRIVSSSHDLVTVRRGDTLWSIAARHLGPSASDAEIAHEWPRWYAANRDALGDDPDLLLPGQQLRPPTIHTEQGVQR